MFLSGLCLSAVPNIPHKKMRMSFGTTATCSYLIAILKAVTTTEQTVTQEVNKKGQANFLNPRF